MKLLELDRKKGIMSLLMENLDDLWHLYNVLAKGDMVYAKTTREIKIRDVSGRFSEGRRIPLTLGIKVTEILFDKAMNRLRIRGTVSEAPERYEDLKGSYHTISMQPDGRIKIVKQNIRDYHLDRIKTACKPTSPPIVVVSIDDEDACIATVRQFDVDVKFEKTQKLPGKREPEKRRGAIGKYFAEVAQALQQTLKSTDGSLVVVGPGFIKDEFAKYIRENLQLPSVNVASASSAGLSGVNEAIRSGALRSIIKRNRILEETHLVEKFLAFLASEHKKVAYGTDETETATKYGAVENLIIVDRLLREISEDGRLRLEMIMRQAEKKGGKVTIISGEHEAGHKILSLGGVAAILRFPIQ